MSEQSRQSVDELRAEVASAFGGDVDPLARNASTFEELDVDPFALFLSEALEPENPADDTRVKFERVIGQWRELMDREGRHPACPNEHP